MKLSVCLLLCAVLVHVYCGKEGGGGHATDFFVSAENTNTNGNTNQMPDKSEDKFATITAELASLKKEMSSLVARVTKLEGNRRGSRKNKNKRNKNNKNIKNVKGRTKPKWVNCNREGAKRTQERMKEENKKDRKLFRRKKNLYQLKFSLLCHFKHGYESQGLYVQSQRFCKQANVIGEECDEKKLDLIKTKLKYYKDLQNSCANPSTEAIRKVLGESGYASCVKMVCPDGFQCIHGQCYRTVIKALPRDNAAAKCAEHKSSLLTLTSAEQEAALMKVGRFMYAKCKKVNYPTRLWTAGRWSKTQEQYEWSTGETTTPFSSYTNWHKKSKHENPGEKHCVSLAGAAKGSKWWNSICKKRLGFTCQTAVQVGGQ